jgi:hypothetical protein
LIGHSSAWEKSTKKGLFIALTNEHDTRSVGVVDENLVVDHGCGYSPSWPIQKDLTTTAGRVPQPRDAKRASVHVEVDVPVGGEASRRNLHRHPVQRVEGLPLGCRVDEQKGRLLLGGENEVGHGRNVAACHEDVAGFGLDEPVGRCLVIEDGGHGSSLRISHVEVVDGAAGEEVGLVEPRSLHAALVGVGNGRESVEGEPVGLEDEIVAGSVDLQPSVADLEADVNENCVVEAARGEATGLEMGGVVMTCSWFRVMMGYELN